MLTYFIFYIYVMVGVFMAFKTFKRPLGKLIMSVYWGLFWLPLIVSNMVLNNVDLGGDRS